MKNIIILSVVVVILSGVGIAMFYFDSPLGLSPASSVGPVPMPPTVFQDKISVTYPLTDNLVKSPLKVQGEARGSWYFEASFPVRLYDADGKELAVAVAQAKGEWMTEEFVPFEAVLTFTTPVTPTGKLVLQKDNPSGLPEHDDSVSIPVRFE